MCFVFVKYALAQVQSMKIFCKRKIKTIIILEFLLMGNNLISTTYQFKFSVKVISFIPYITYNSIFGLEKLISFTDDNLMIFRILFSHLCHV